MLKLRELTMQHHKNAERSEFAKKLVSGKVNALEYTLYLYNMRYVYSSIEMTAKRLGVLEGLRPICRKSSIGLDYNQMLNMLNMNISFELCEATVEYVDYLSTLNDPEKILAHVYVRHMGDLSGGQIIAKKLKGKYPTNFYEFTVDTEILKEKLREKLNNDMAEEAMLAFDYAHKIFLELDSLRDNSKPEGNSETSE